MNNGRSLYEVQKLLGHTQVKTTQRYSHLQRETLIEAVDIVSRAIPLLEAMPAAVIDVPLVAVGSS